MLNLIQLNRNIRSIRRYRQIVKILIKYGFDHLLEYFNLSQFVARSRRVLRRNESTIAQLSPAERMRLALEELGPSFTEVPQYKYFAEVPKTYELYAYPRLAVTDEAFTKLAERLVKAYQDKSLLDNPAGITKVVHEAAEETNEILKENKLYCGK